MDKKKHDEELPCSPVRGLGAPENNLKGIELY